jgi:ribosomal protein S18 acetylase RimI-like enzyme
MITEQHVAPLNLTYAPVIPGLTFRRFRGEADYPAMAAIVQASYKADEIDDITTVDDIARVYSHLDNCDPYQDMVFVEANGRAVGFNRVTWWQEQGGDRIYYHFGYLLPEWRGRGIGRAMLRRSERRLRKIAEGHAVACGQKLAAGAQDTQPGLKSLLREEGYYPIRYFYEMTRDLAEEIPTSPLPEGLEVRPVQPEHYRAVWEADQRAFQDHWGYSPGTENGYQRWLKHPTFNPELWQVAWHGDQVVGMVLNFIDERENEKYGRKRGYTEDISVQREWRRRGIAKALIARSLQMHKELGMTETALGVDTKNPNGALHLYESLGYKPVKRGTAYRKPLRSKEWHN